PLTTFTVHGIASVHRAMLTALTAGHWSVRRRLRSSVHARSFIPALSVHPASVHLGTSVRLASAHLAASVHIGLLIRTVHLLTGVFARCVHLTIDDTVHIRRAIIVRAFTAGQNRGTPPQRASVVRVHLPDQLGERLVDVLVAHHARFHRYRFASERILLAKTVHP